MVGGVHPAEHLGEEEEHQGAEAEIAGEGFRVAVAEVAVEDSPEVVQGVEADFRVVVVVSEEDDKEAEEDMYFFVAAFGSSMSGLYIASTQMNRVFPFFFLVQPWPKLISSRTSALIVLSYPSSKSPLVIFQRGIQGAILTDSDSDNALPSEVMLTPATNIKTRQYE